MIIKYITISNLIFFVFLTDVLEGNLWGMVVGANMVAVIALILFKLLTLKKIKTTNHETNN